MMTPAELELRRYAVQGLVAEAGRMALDYFGKQESLGVTMKGAQDWLTVADGHRTHHLHVVVHAGNEWRRRIVFRDALRSNSKLARRYAALKTELAVRHRNDRDAYTDAKSEFILSVARDA